MFSYPDYTPFACSPGASTGGYRSVEQERSRRSDLAVGPPGGSRYGHDPDTTVGGRNAIRSKGRGQRLTPDVLSAVVTPKWSAERRAGPDHKGPAGSLMAAIRSGLTRPATGPPHKRAASSRCSTPPLGRPVPHTPGARRRGNTFGVLTSRAPRRPLVSTGASQNIHSPQRLALSHKLRRRVIEASSEAPRDLPVARRSPEPPLNL
jgi:hypothetical protein